MPADNDLADVDLVPGEGADVPQLPRPLAVRIYEIAVTVPGYRVESWYGLYVPAATPAAVIERLNTAARKAARSPDFVRKLEHEGLVVNAGPAAELDTYVQAEEKRWAQIVRQNNIHPD